MTATGTDLFAERYRAIAARDARFDGQFFTAVHTTRIYCRPSCPARTPRPENVTFYLTSAAAHEAGYRACKRCLPEAAPGTPAWNLRRDLAGRAMRLLADGVVDREGVAGLAGRLGYSPRHVHRLLVAELGAGPLALARAQRAQTARALLAGTDLRLADVAFAAGFGSIRQFNDTVQDVFATTPGALRGAATRVRAGRRGQAAHDRAAHNRAAHDRAAHDEAAHDEAARAPVPAPNRGPARDPGPARGEAPRGAGAAESLRGADGGDGLRGPDGADGLQGADGHDHGPGHAPARPADGERAHPARVLPRAETTVRLALRLPVRAPFDAPGIFAFLAARAMDGVESASLDPSALRYARTLTLPHGPAALEVTATPTVSPEPGPRRAGCAATRQAWTLRLRVELTSLADVAAAVARARRLLDLDADPVAVDTALAVDAALAPLVAATPGIRVPGAVDPHELVLRAIVGQQISVAAARTHLSRLAARLGTPYASGFAGLTTLFPSPATIAAGVPVADPGSPAASDPDRPLRLPARGVSAVVGAARALADGTLAVDVGADPEALRAALTALPGVGPWTAAYVAMRVLGDPDAWLDGDVALLAGAAAAGVAPPAGLPAGRRHRDLAARAAAWAPWRSYAAMHLWRAATTPDAAPAPRPERTPHDRPLRHPRHARRTLHRRRLRRRRARVRLDRRRRGARRARPPVAAAAVGRSRRRHDGRRSGRHSGRRSGRHHGRRCGRNSARHHSRRNGRYHRRRSGRHHGRGCGRNNARHHSRRNGRHHRRHSGRHHGRR
ncbi:DNA-3-methyladenine glycosylase 2 family protein [Xylanimonas allomyrinae]|uniref:DNA-3-methyladenine glycosylase 2 family protein n=1 Tax=Xylanimonas allomyrinae TaxID=2509459 RepID=UPI001FEA851B|nr:Ada metal-binding domain-containing protein [Xylanimonas allomyrinae]